MKQVIDTSVAALRAMATGCLIILFVLVTAQVVLRYGFRTTPVFTSEMARYALVWLTLAGTAVAVREDSHIRVTLIVDLLPPLLRRALAGVLDLAQIGLFCTFAWYGLDAALFALGQRSDGLQLPLGYPYMALPIFFALAAVLGVATLIGRWVKD
jgi:TRAP-type transport system small permease protein